MGDGRTNDTFKNYFPQLFKTSPASIAYLIRQNHQNVVPYFRKLVTGEEAHKIIPISGTIRDLMSLNRLGKLPNQRPDSEVINPKYPPYTAIIDGMGELPLVPLYAIELVVAGLSRSSALTRSLKCLLSQCLGRPCTVLGQAPLRISP